MNPAFRLTSAVPADAAAVTEVVAALESSLYGPSTFSQADLESEWATDLELERDARVVRDGDRIVGYGLVRERGELWRVEGYVHPDALGRGIGKLIATGLEKDAALGGARRVQNAVLEADSAACRLLESLGYAAVRLFRELRIELEARPPAPEWPDGLRVVPFDPERDALEFHTAHHEAFLDHWDSTPRDFESWSRAHLGSVGAALLGDAFSRFWERGERTVGLGVDAASDTGAFRLYERAGMAPALGWAVYEKELVGPA
jgi:mycothiol synthase